MAGLQEELRRDHASGVTFGDVGYEILRPGFYPGWKRPQLCRYERDGGYTRVAAFVDLEAAEAFVAWLVAATGAQPMEEPNEADE